MRLPLRRCFPAGLWSRTTVRLWLCLLAVILWFDIEWCLATTFTAFSMPETWVNTLLLSLLLSMPQMLWHKGRLQSTVTLLAAVWFECNLMYSRTYFAAIPLGSYAMAGNLADFTASVADSLRPLDAVFMLPVAASFLIARRKQTPRPAGAALPYFVYFVILSAISGLLLARRGGLTKAWSTLANANYHSCRVPMYTLVGSLVNDAATATAPLSDADRTETERWLAKQRTLAPHPDSTGRDNIVWILCESLESWPIGLTVQGKEITPCLNRLVSDTTTLYAPHVVSQVGAGRSIDAQLLINAGMLPMLTGVYATDRPGNTYHTLTKAFAAARSTRSYLLTVDKPSTWNQEAVARAFGIDTIIARDSWVNDEKVGSRKKLGDRSFARQIAEKMRSGEIWPDGEHAFVQIVTYSGHNPFILPETLDNLRLDRDKLPATVANYLTMTHYTDAAIGLLVDCMRSRPDFARTMIVITGDHEGLAAERPALNAACSYVSPHQEAPLIVVNSPAGGTHEAVMGQVDIYPTLLDLAGIDSPWRGMGRSILDPSFPGVAVGSQLDIRGDSTALSADELQHIKDARKTSDRIIIYNLLH